LPRSAADWVNGKGLQPLIQLPSFPFTPVLGWSSTRAEIFRTCRRRYFYQYYAKYDREIPMGRILHLKTLSSIPMTIGTGVHDILATVLTRLQKSDRDLGKGRLAAMPSAIRIPSALPCAASLA
jgi:hypothetical protein